MIPKAEAVFGQDHAQAKGRTMIAIRSDRIMVQDAATARRFTPPR